MRIIEKIEIENFRSIKNLTIENIQEEVLIFSGPNSSGKTNILRAINLFFNDEVEPRTPLSVADIHQFGAKKSPFVRIKIDFNISTVQRLTKQKKLPNTFSVEKKWGYYHGVWKESITFVKLTEKQSEDCENLFFDDG